MLLLIDRQLSSYELTSNSFMKLS